MLAGPAPAGVTSETTCSDTWGLAVPACTVQCGTGTLKRSYQTYLILNQTLSLAVNLKFYTFHKCCKGGSKLFWEDQSQPTHSWCTVSKVIFLCRNLLI